MTILQDLYFGNLSPFERGPKTDEYRAAKEKAYAAFKALSAELGEGMRTQLEKVVDLHSDVMADESEFHFVEGFRLGALMMIDIFGKNP